MAIIERPANDTLAAPTRTRAVTATSSYGYFRRPVETEGWRSWAFTVDHKKIGIMYGVTAMLFFVIGGLEAEPDPSAARAARRHGAVGRQVQPDVHDARHHDGVPVRDADGGSVRQLLHPAADRCTRRRLPATQRPVVLGVHLRWHLLEHIVVPRRRCRRRLVHVRTELRHAVLTEQRRRLLGSRPADHRHRLAGRCDQPDHHRAEHACARHVADEDADLHVDGLRRRSCCCCSPSRSSRWHCSC